MCSGSTCCVQKTRHSSKTWYGAWQYEQPGLWIGSELIWLTLAGSFVSRASILLIRVAILASAAMVDSKDKSPHFEAIDCEFLDFSEVGSHCRVFSTRSSNKFQSWFSSFFKNPPDTWFLTRSLTDNSNHHREYGTDVIFLHRDEGTELRDLESFKVSPEWFTLFLPKLHDILSDEGSLVDWVKFLQEGLDEIVPHCNWIYSQTVQLFFI